MQIPNNPCCGAGANFFYRSEPRARANFLRRLRLYLRGEPKKKPCSRIKFESVPFIKINKIQNIILQFNFIKSKNDIVL